MVTKYCTVQDVVDSLGWGQEIPEFIPGQTPSVETVDDSGTLSSGSIIYLDNNNVISGSLILSHGPDASNLTQLTLDTDYTFDPDKAKITITAAGATAIGTDSVFAEEYSYIQIDGRPGIKSTVIGSHIDRAVTAIDNYCNQTWQAAQNVIREEHLGKGYRGRMYRPYNLLPLIVDTQLNGAVDNSTTTFTLDTTSGLIAGSHMTIENEVVSIDSVDTSTQITVTRGEFGTSAASHADNSPIINVVIETSSSTVAQDPIYEIAEYPGEFQALAESGFFQLQYDDITREGLYVNQFPQKGVADRVRLSYTFGTDDGSSGASVPADIEQACIFQVMRWLTTNSIAKAISDGIDGFTPVAQETLSEDVKLLLSENRLILGRYS